MKSLIKNTLYYTLYYTGLVHLFLKAYWLRRKNYPVVILTYHRIVKDYSREVNTAKSINHPVENFRKEMQFLKKWFNVVSLDEVAAIIKGKKPADKPTVAITIDDGFDDNYSLAYPVLKSLGLPATIFLTAGCINTSRLPWVEELDEAFAATDRESMQLNSVFKNKVFALRTLKQKQSAYEYIVPKLKHLTYSKRREIIADISQALGVPKTFKRRMLNWQEVKEMAENNITFGAHTMTHPILSRMSLFDAKKEIFDSKQVIERALNKPVKHFAFPNGRLEDFSPELKAYCKDIGFESICACAYGPNRQDADVFMLRRISPGRNFPTFVIDLIRSFYR